MARNLNLLTRRKNPYAKAQGVNPEGFPSFQRSVEEAYLQVLLTNTLGGTFYATVNDLLKESLSLHGEMAAKDPKFMARAIVYARNEGLMRLQPLVGLGYLAKADTELFKRIFSRVILTPGDLTDFVEIVRGGVIPGGMGRAIKTAINGWLNGMSEYHALKYASGGQGYSLRDILRVSHPKPMTAIQNSIFLWLTDREKWLLSDLQQHTPQIVAFEKIKRLDNANSDQTALRELIAEGRLPYEIVTGVAKPDRETWAGLMRQMPYFALLRHLNTLQRAETFQDEDNVKYVTGRLSNQEAVKKAKVLPFRLFMAHAMFNVAHTAEWLIPEALIDALEAAFVNMPNLGGRVCIAPDVSGSMGGVISRGSKVRYSDIAGIFSGALLKACPSALVMPFETKVLSAKKFSARDSIMTNAGKIARLGGGGTAVSAPISQMLADKTRVDTFIGITDNIEWATDNFGGTGFLPVWREYKANVAPNAQAFLITIAPYRHAVAPVDEPGIHYIYGWNDNVLTYIAMNVAGLKGQVDAVRNMDI